jgi:hypothetical protein
MSMLSVTVAPFSSSIMRKRERMVELLPLLRRVRGRNKDHVIKRTNLPLRLHTPTFSPGRMRRVRSLRTGFSDLDLVRLVS